MTSEQPRHDPESGEEDIQIEDGMVVLSWVVKKTATNHYYRIVVSPAGDDWVIIRQKRRGITENWRTTETHDATEKPSLVGGIEDG